MGTIADMARRVKAINLTDLAGAIIDQHTEELADLNRKQLMQGKDNKGDLLGPKHSENPFFKSPESAARYARWKQKITPDTPFDVPNLHIIGVFHGGISFRREADKVIARASGSLADRIARTFKDAPLGLNPESKVEVARDIVRNPLVHAVAKQLNVKTV